jgi:Ser/Thr protein kinase RdoA (MazF antagonist)
MGNITAARTALEAWESVVGAAKLEPLPLVTNPVWRVDAEDGRQFVLKYLPETAPGVEPVEQFRVLCHLQSAGVPVVLPIITDSGSIRMPAGERSYALMPLVPSDRSNHELGTEASATACAIGTAIGQMDKALADCPWQVHSYIDDPAPEILGKVFPKLPAEITRPVSPFVDQLWAAVSKLPTQRTVGDCNTGNVLVHDSRVSAFIDLDHLPMGPRVWDLSDYLVSRLRMHLSQPDSAERDTAAMLAVLGRYVAGYHQTYPLTQRELTAVVPLILVIDIGLAGWRLHGWVPDPEGYQQCVRSISWITANLDVLTTAAGTPPMVDSVRT